MEVIQRTLESELTPHLDRFFEAQPKLLVLQDHVWDAVNRLNALNFAIPGKPQGWAAGIVYAMATWGRSPCGVPEILNRDFEAMFGTTMNTVYRRAAAIRRALEPAMTPEDYAVFFAGLGS